MRNIEVGSRLENMAAVGNLPEFTTRNLEARNAHHSIPRSSSDGDMQQNYHFKLNGHCHHHQTIDDNIHHIIVIVAAAAPAAGSRHSNERNTAGMKYLVPVLLLLVGIKYQVSPDLLFVDNDIQHWFFVGTLCIYWITIQMLDKWSHLNRKLIYMLNCIVDACDVLSVVSLLSLLFPHDVSILVFIALTSSSLLLAVIVEFILLRREIAQILKRFSRATVGHSLPV